MKTNFLLLMTIVGIAVGCGRTSLRPGTGADGGADSSAAATESPRHGGSIALGLEHTCVVGNAGVVFCYGAGGVGQLGDGNTSISVPSTTPVQVKQLSDVVAVTAGGRHTCALDKRGEVSCWGDGSYGALGNGNESVSTMPHPVAGLAEIVQVSAGNAHTCALQRTGRLFCWGKGEAGQVGDGARKIVNRVPVELKGLPNVVDVSAGDRHTCAVSDSFELYCWGEGANGRLGSGSVEGSATPRKVEALKDVIEVGVSRSHSCARLRAGSVRCWGDGGRGQLGTGRRDSAITPVAVANVDGAIALSLGNGQTCALMRDGGVSCWGEGEEIAGAVYPSNQLLPHRIDGVHEASEIRLASSFRFQGDDTCLRMKSREVQCWNSRGYGTVRGDLPGYRDTMRTPKRVTIP